MKLAILLLFPSLAFAQSIIGAEGPDGNIIPVWNLPHQRCPLPVPEGYASMVVAIVGHGDDPQVRAHELEHVAGLRHSSWERWGVGMCARITQAGRTNWTVGRLMCRRDSGDYFEIGD